MRTKQMNNIYNKELFADDTKLGGKEVRIKEVNKKFYPQRRLSFRLWFHDIWTSEWPSKFINGEWCGDFAIYGLDSLEEAKEFLNNREVKYHKLDGTVDLLE